ncbi:MAG: hypothetical protein NT065_05305 [Chlamydiae bacterium]|nr:hypothetical protein [Chlamydiota bacterium]
MILFGTSCLIIIWSTYDIVTLTLLSGRNTTGTFLNSMMDEVAYIVFAVAVADVARYLLVEEVLRSKETRPLVEKRRALLTLILIIAAAFALEGLILTLQMAKTSIEKLIYPILLLVVFSILLVSLGVYQKLSGTRSKE